MYGVGVGSPVPTQFRGGPSVDHVVDKKRSDAFDRIMSLCGGKEAFMSLPESAVTDLDDLLHIDNLGKLFLTLDKSDRSCHALSRSKGNQFLDF